MKQKFDRRAVMKNAHRQWRQSQRLGLGWDWAKCQRRAWEIAKGKRALEIERSRPRIVRDIIRLAA